MYNKEKGYIVFSEEEKEELKKYIKKTIKG